MYRQFSRDEHNFFVGHLSASLHQQTKHESNGLLVLLGQEKGQAITIFCILFDHETFSLETLMTKTSLPIRYSTIQF